MFDESCCPVQLDSYRLSCLMYADDLVLFLSESSTGLQSALEKLGKYCDKWKLTVNLNKTKVIIFNKGGHNIFFFYKLNEIEIVQNYCYLGIEFSAAGTFNGAIAKLKDKANKTLF